MSMSPKVSISEGKRREDKGNLWSTFAVEYESQLETTEGKECGHRLREESEAASKSIPLLS